MKYIQLLENIKGPIFSLQDLKISGLKAFSSQLSLLADEKKVIRLKNGLYVIKSREDIIKPEAIAHSLYQPSYISLERALFHYGLIPEMVYGVTSVTPKTTRTFHNDFGQFIYRHIKKELFWGYRSVEVDNQFYLIAEPEKALLDFLYFNRWRIKNEDDLVEMRFNPDLATILDQKRLADYLCLFADEKIEQLVSMLCSPSNK